MTVYLGSRCTIMLNSYDAIKEALVKMLMYFRGDLRIFSLSKKSQKDMV